MADDKTMISWQTVKNAVQCMKALALCEAKGHRAVVETAVAKARQVAAELTAEGRPTSTVEVLARFTRDALARQDVLAVYFSAAIAVELRLEPDTTARAEAEHLTHRDQN
jgi:hypothetical protein